MKFFLEKKLNTFCLTNELLSIWFGKNLDIDILLTNSPYEKNVLILNNLSYYTVKAKNNGRFFQIRFPGIYEFSGIITNVHALPYNDIIKNVPQINLSKDLDITHIADPELFNVNRHKNLLEYIEETKILVLHCQDDKEEHIKLIKELIDAIEPQFIIPYSDNNHLNLEQYISKLFGANFLKTKRLVIKPSLIHDLKERFILL